MWRRGRIGHYDTTLGFLLVLFTRISTPTCSGSPDCVDRIPVKLVKGGSEDCFASLLCRRAISNSPCLLSRLRGGMVDEKLTAQNKIVEAEGKAMSELRKRFIAEQTEVLTHFQPREQSSEKPSRGRHKKDLRHAGRLTEREEDAALLQVYQPACLP
eukprot:2038555-Rhodomonas_salina.1